LLSVISVYLIEAGVGPSSIFAEVFVELVLIIFFGAKCAWGGTWKKVFGIILRNEKNIAGATCFRKQLNLPPVVPESAALSFRKAYWRLLPCRSRIQCCPEMREV
jgi:hypothetical protein